VAVGQQAGLVKVVMTLRSEAASKMGRLLFRMSYPGRTF
jgi:hypothetical protein